MPSPFRHRSGKLLGRVQRCRLGRRGDGPSPGGPAAGPLRQPPPQRVEVAYGEAAFSLGASKLKAFREIVVPVVLPAVVTGTTLGDMERESSLKERWLLWERSMVYRQHRSFVNCIKEGKQPFANADVALQGALVPLAAQRSLKTGEVVQLAMG